MNRRRNLLVGVGLVVLLLGLIGQIAWAVERPAQPVANEDIAINEVYYRGVSSADDWIELRNTGTETIDVGNWWFCARFDYERIGLLTIVAGDDFILVPGEILVVRPWTDLDDNASDLALYTDGNFSNPASLVDFVQWGSGGPIGRANVAVSKGIWRELASGVYDFVPTAGNSQSLAWRGINSGGGLLTHSTDWQNGTPTQGQNNEIPALTSTPTATPTATITPTSTSTPTHTSTATPTATTEPQKSLYLPLVTRN
ncbi:MAG: lamin tail domain-containing protein [Chloroflexi bacterium]|nr:lamin tail domain-containing protein [Chloroflexota bacterium]